MVVAVHVRVLKLLAVALASVDCRHVDVNGAVGLVVPRPYAWPAVPHKTCWGHTLGSANFLDYGKAMVACTTAGDACSGLYPMPRQSAAWASDTDYATPGLPTLDTTLHTAVRVACTRTSLSIKPYVVLQLYIS